MTFETSPALVDVAGDVVVLVGHLVTLVLVAVDARESLEIRGNNVAFGTIEPRVIAPLDREVHRVVEVGVLPVPRVVAALTHHREAGSPVVWVSGAVVVRLVAGEAVGRGTGESVCVAERAVEGRVCPGQREEGVVVEVRAEAGVLPRLGPMAGLTVGRKTSLGVIRFSRRFVVSQVAGHAVGRRVRVLEGGRLSVTRLAVDTSVRPGKGKEGRVVDICHSPTIVPTTRRVAIFATVSELSTVGVEMAVCTGGRNVRKDEALMAGRTVLDPMSLLQCKTGLRVVKGKGLHQNPPPLRRVALTARDTEDSVRLAGRPKIGRSISACALRRRCEEECSHGRHRERTNQNSDETPRSSCQYETLIFEAPAPHCGASNRLSPIST